jgi:hypothetical protein
LANEVTKWLSPSLLRAVGKHLGAEYVKPVFFGLALGQAIPWVSEHAISWAELDGYAPVDASMGLSSVCLLATITVAMLLQRETRKRLKSFELMITAMKMSGHTAKQIQTKSKSTIDALAEHAKAQALGEPTSAPPALAPVREQEAE